MLEVLWNSRIFMIDIFFDWWTPVIYIFWKNLENLEKCYVD